MSLPSALSYSNSGVTRLSRVSKRSSCNDRDTSYRASPKRHRLAMAEHLTH